MYVESLDKLLSLLTTDDKINTEDVLNKVIEMKNEAIINEHQEKFAIWQGSNNGRWYSYLPDTKKKDGRRQIVKSSKEALNKVIIDYYKTNNDNCDELKITLATFYKEWMKYKAKHIPSTRSLRIIDDYWKKYYLNTPIIDIPLVKLKKIDLDDWAHDIIHEYHMTKTEYYNMAIIFRQSLDYAVSKDILSSNPFSSFKINSKLFRKVKKKPSNTQVFLTDEQPLIEEAAFNDFIESGYTACLAIPLSRQLGTRIGEIVALEWDDINDEVQDHVHIQRMESKIENQDAQGNWLPANIVVVEHTKSAAGDRNVFLTKEAKRILTMIKDWNNQHGFSDSKYIFLNPNGERIHEDALDCRIRKYCNKIGISEKGMHKIRKTYISMCIAGGTNINYLREQVGHESETTTYNSYCFDCKPKAETQFNIEKALNPKKE